MLFVFPDQSFFDSLNAGPDSALLDDFNIDE
jgi:hypothetical protein